MSTNKETRRIVATMIRECTAEHKDGTKRVYYLFSAGNSRKINEFGMPTSKTFNTLEEAIEYRDTYFPPVERNYIPKDHRLSSKLVERSIREIRYRKVDGTDTVYYEVSSRVKIDGKFSKRQTFSTLEDAKMYRDLVDNRKKVVASEAIDISHTGKAWPENICKALDITIDNYPDTYDEIVDNFEKRFNELHIYTDREMTIFNLRFKEYKTYDEIGIEIGVSKERIRQILAKSIRKLKRPTIFNRFIVQENKLELLNAEETARIRDELKNEMSVDVAMEIIAKKYGFESPEEFDDFMQNKRVTKIDILIKDISELDLCVREYSCLKRARIDTIDELVEREIDDLFKIRNLGRKSLRNIVNKVHDLGLTFKNDDYDPANIVAKDEFNDFNRSDDHPLVVLDKDGNIVKLTKTEGVEKVDNNFHAC